MDDTPILDDLMMQLLDILLTAISTAIEIGFSLVQQLISIILLQSGLTQLGGSIPGLFGS